MLLSMHTNKHTDVLRAFMCTHIHTYTHTYVQTYKHTSKHTHIYIYIYTQTPIYTHIQAEHACMYTSIILILSCLNLYFFHVHLFHVSTCCLRVYVQVHVHIHGTCVQQKRFHRKPRLLVTFLNFCVYIYKVGFRKVLHILVYISMYVFMLWVCFPVRVSNCVCFRAHTCVCTYLGQSQKDVPFGLCMVTNMVRWYHYPKKIKRVRLKTCLEENDA